MIYFNFIRYNILGEDDFQKYIKKEKLQHEENIDASPGSGFHLRKRKKHAAKD